MPKKRPALTVVPSHACIEVRGARQNNLKGFDLDLPLGKLIVVTGPSGSGKSSLAFDTIYAEGQRRYVETFSPYTRQFLDRMDKPRVDEIRGIPPAIAIEQTNNVKSTRSTVGTMTEINDYLKLIFPRIATARCPECSQEIRPESAKSIVEHVFEQHAGETVLVTFGVPAPAGTKPADFFSFLQQQGYLRVWLDGEILRTDEEPQAKRLPAIVEVIQDRVTISEEGRARLTEAAEHALRLGSGKLAVRHPDTGFRHPYSTGWHCAHCDVDITPPTPGLFSFNHPLGACPTCRGFGRTIAIDLQRAIPDHSLSVADGCVKPFQTESGADCQRDLLRCAKAKDVDVSVPFSEMPESEQEWVLEGEDSLRSASQRRDGEELWKEGLWYGVRGFFRWLESKAYKMHVRVLLSRYRNYSICPDCRGGRYQPATLNYRFAGKTLPELQAMPIEEFVAALVKARALSPGDGSARALTSTATDEATTPSTFDLRPSTLDSTTEMLLGEVRSRLGYLLEVGLGYLSLDRPTRTLSGGEVERVNLTTCLGASLVNTLFVLDEPSIGLHPRDTGRLIRVMKSLRDKGNTLLVVEHEEAVMRAADHLVELGPGRGESGGELVFSGAFDADWARRTWNSELGTQNSERDGRQKKSRRADAKELRVPSSKFQVPSSSGLTLTQQYLTGEKSIPIPAARRKPSAWLRIEGAREHNLRNLTVEFPLGVFACVTGVSGSGKSTLVHSVLYENLLNAKGIASANQPGALKKLVGARQISQVILVDQTQLSRTPKSTAALYLGIFDDIREMFAMTDEALREGLSASAFSFNGGAGRCERCGGSGFEKIEMQFLSDVFVRCPECEGRRYQPHVLKIRVEGKSIHDVLELTVTEAVKFFEKRDAKRVAAPLRVLEEVGLGYIRLGQPLNVLSGGESQRLKLVERLTQQDSANALLILDEPTTGLHFDDVAMLVKVFDRLVEQGNSLLVIEHNLEVIKCADHVIDLGPEAGTQGGLLVAKGTPEEVAGVEESHTGRYLRDVLRGTRDAQPWSAAASDSATPPWQERSDAAGDDEQTARVAEETPLASHASEGGVALSLATAVQGAMPASAIGIHGAREHNLKNITLSIPRDQLVVITGLSGSGKSTLAFDLLFAEGQRRFLDVMSPYARQFIEQLEKPDVDRITGLPPSVAIEQRVTRGGGKSTVATVTEVYHFLRLLFSKLGVQHCPDCGCAVESQTAAAVTRRVEDFAKRGRISVFATLVKARKGFHTDIAKWARRQGFETLLVDGKLVRVDEFTKLERFREHTIEVLVGERTPADTRGPRKRRLAELVNSALKIGRGTIRVLDANKRGTILSTEQACPDCGLSFDELDPRLFSFNSPHGWCTECRGFGEVWKHYVNPRLETALEQELDIERQGESLEEGEAVPCPSCKGERLNPQARAVRLKTSNVQRPTSNVQSAAKDSRTSGRRPSRTLDVGRSTLDVGRSLSITDFSAMSVNDALTAVSALTFTAEQKPISQDIVPEIIQRLTFMGKVGLDYLGLGRSAKTLSGGESQRIRLSAQLGSNLRGVLYVLDEPTIGLHPRDNDALLDTLIALRGKGNSLVVVEHDEETMRRADTVVDLGPLAGVHGGEVCAIGSLDDIAACERSATGKYLRHPLKHPTRGTRRSLEAVQWLELHGARTNNLKDVDVRFPIGCLSVITGISGSGKSTLMRGVLKPMVQAALKLGARRSGTAVPAVGVRRASSPVAARRTGGDACPTLTAETAVPLLRGVEFIEAVHEVDQSPIGKTSRSTPATYLGVFNEIRALFAQLPASRMRGYTASRFSFNTEGGRCETCGGQGVIRMEMAFLPTSYQPCTDCHGKRFNPATLEALYNEKSIGDVMEMSLAEAAEFFKAAPKIHRPLALLCDTGLGYLRLGQPSPTLSGGEAQRLKLVAELVQGVARDANSRLRRQREPKSTLYLLEEPTIGLHMADVAELLKVLHRLVDDGATVLVIEHNLSLIADADYVVDIGPEAGAAGGEVVAFGTPEEVALHEVSRTAPFLRPLLKL
jgi:excinuclease ABC subunit A